MTRGHRAVGDGLRKDQQRGIPVQVQAGQPGLPVAGLRAVLRALRRNGGQRPEQFDRVLLSRQQLRQPVQAGREGEARERRADRRRLSKTITLAVEKLDANDPVQAKIKALSLQFLMAAYGPDKLDDPVKAEPVVIRLIQLDPGEPANYFQLAKLYEDAGESEAAEKVYIAAKDAKPTDVNTYIQLAGYLQPPGQLQQGDRGVRAAGRPRAQQPRGVLHGRHAVLGPGLSRRGREGRGQENLRAEGSRQPSTTRYS